MMSSLFLHLWLVCRTYSKSTENLPEIEKILILDKEKEMWSQNPLNQELLEIYINSEKLKSLRLESQGDYDEIQVNHFEKNEICLQNEEIRSSELPTFILITSHVFHKTIIYKCFQGNLLGFVNIDPNLFEDIKEKNQVLNDFDNNLPKKFKRYLSKELNELDFVNEYKRNKRKMVRYTDFRYYVTTQHGQCIGCGILDFPDWDLLTAIDLDRIFNDFRDWTMTNKSYCYYCPYISICDIEISLMASIKLAKSNSKYYDHELCEFLFEPRYFLFTNLNNICEDKYSNLTKLFIDYNIACLVHYWSKYYSVYSNYYLSKISLAKSNIISFLLKTFKSGWKPIGSLINYESSVFGTNSYINVSCEIGTASNFPTFQSSQCDNSNNILLKTFIRFVNISQISDVVSIDYATLGYTQVINGTLNATFNQASTIYTNPSKAYETIKINTYIDITNGIKFFAHIPKSYIISGPYMLGLNINIGLYIISPVCEQDCSFCRNFTYCEQCLSKNYKINGTCYSCPVGCQSCSGPDICSSCISGYWLNSTNSSCSNCVINCAYCANNNCSTCLNGFGLDMNNNCIACSDINCNYCSNNYMFCNECKVGCEINSTLGTCFACPQNCLRCFENFTCYTCLSGFYLTDSKECAACHPDCYSCNTNSSCLSCKYPFSLVSTSGLYNIDNLTLACNCQTGYGIQNTTSGLVCQSCELECNYCNYSTICISCKSLNTIIANGKCQCAPGYYNNTDLVCSSSCLKCPIDCLECDSNANCTSCISLNTRIIQGSCVCNPGFKNLTLLTANDSCIACGDECQVCISDNQCTLCSAENTLIQNGYCVCKSGFYNTSNIILNNSCIPCPYGCSTCDSTGGCICDDGYFGTIVTAADSCKLCHFECATCVNDTMCLKCKYPLMSPSSTIGCDCVLGYFKDQNSGQCSICHPGCSSCAEYPLCLTCVDKHGIPSSIGGCECPLGYFNDSSGACSPCLPECKTCSEAKTCLSCKDINSELDATGRCSCFKLFYPNMTGNYSECVPCSNQCLSCDSKGVCLECLDPNSEPSGLSCSCKLSFYLNDSSLQCEACQDFCMNCTSFNNCHSCVSSKTFGDLCTSCHASCNTCEGPEEFECTSCEYFLQNGFCFRSCALGYVANGDNCELQYPGKPVLRFSFEGLGSVFYDTINEIAARVVKKDKSRRLENDYGLISSYKRGIYFTGLSNLRVRFTDQHLLTSNFSISVWLKPKVSHGTILVKYGGLYLNVLDNQESKST